MGSLQQPSMEEAERHFLGNLFSDEDSFIQQQHLHQYPPSVANATRETGALPSRSSLLSSAGPLGPSLNQTFWPEPPPPYSPPCGSWLSGSQSGCSNSKELQTWRGSTRPLHSNPTLSLPSSPVEDSNKTGMPFSYRDAVNRGVREESSFLLPGKEGTNDIPSPQTGNASSRFSHSSTGISLQRNASTLDRKDDSSSSQSEFQKITRKKGGTAKEVKSEKKPSLPSARPPQQSSRPSSASSATASSASLLFSSDHPVDAPSRFDILHKLREKKNGNLQPELADTAARNGTYGSGRSRWVNQSNGKRGGNGARLTNNQSRPNRRKEQNHILLLARACVAWLLWLSEQSLSYVLHLLTDVAFQCFALAAHALRETDGRVRGWFRFFLHSASTSLHQFALSFWNRISGHSSAQLNFSNTGLQENIRLPSNGEEALERLLSVRSEDAYVVLGVREDVSEEDIRRYYKKQAVLVHPDKNSSEGAAEAFQVLSKAFEAIGTSEARRIYETNRFLQSPIHKELGELYSKLREKVEEARNRMECDCGEKHSRVSTPVPLHAARFCKKCGVRHPAKNADIWAESRLFGLFWVYYAAIDGVVYDISAWATCKANELKHLRAGSHQVVYRMQTTGHGRAGGTAHSLPPDYTTFLKKLGDAQRAAAANGSPSSHASLQPPCDREEDRPRKAKRTSKRK